MVHSQQIARLRRARWGQNLAQGPAYGLLGAVLLLAGGGAARAHDADAGPAPSGPAQPIIVTGRGLDAAPAMPAYDTQVLDRATITASASGRIEDVLSNIAGFQQFRRADSRSANPSSQGVTLRALGGNAAARTLVMLDGVPMADPMFGSVPLSAIAPERLSTIRVTHGGGSGAFGAGAVAGTIQMDSADAATLGLFSGESVVDNRGETTLSGTLAPQLGGGFAEISGRWDRGQGFWTTPVDQRVPASARARYDGWSVQARGVAPISGDIELQGRVMAYSDHRTLRFVGANSISTGQDASLRLVGRGPWQFDILAYVQDRGFSNIVISSTTFRPTLDQRRTPATGLGGKVEVRPPLGRDHVLRLGGDWRRASGDLSEVSYNASTGATTGYRHAGGVNGDVGLFAEDDWTVLRGLTLTGGVRADRWSLADGYVLLQGPTALVTANTHYAARADWAVTGRGGALWHVMPGVAVRATAYTGLRQPTINELYRTYTLVASGVSTVTNANPALINEVVKGYEAGIDLTPVSGLNLSATAFYNRLDHAIANVTTAQTATVITRIRQNVNAIRARGLEFAAHADVGPVFLDGSLALTDAVVEQPGAGGALAGNGGLNGKRPAQTPRIAASGTLGWRRSGWQGGVVLRYVGSQYEDDLNASLMPAAATIGAFAQVPLGGPFTLVLRGENLADVAVQTRNQAGSIDLGTPRTVWAGVRVGLK